MTDSLWEENRDLKQKVRHLQVITEDHEPLLKETPSSHEALRRDAVSELELRAQNEGLEKENERLENERASLTDSLTQSKEDRSRHLKEADEDKIKALEERIAASASERTAPSIAEEMAPYEVEEKKLEEKTRKRRGFACRNVLICVMSFALLLLFLLCSVVSTVSACSEASGVQCRELLQEAVRSVIEPYSTLTFTEPPPI
ncbi:hypothetical protein SRHO_G00219550 [Serrasalmus rhombeus]